MDLNKWRTLTGTLLCITYGEGTASSLSSRITVISSVCCTAVFSLFVPHSSLTLVLLVSKTPSYSRSLALITDGDSLAVSWSLLHVTESRLVLCCDTGDTYLAVWLEGLSKVTLSQSIFRVQIWGLKFLILESLIWIKVLRIGKALVNIQMWYLEGIMNPLQGPADYGPVWASSCPPHILVNKALLEHSH